MPSGGTQTVQDEAPNDALKELITAVCLLAFAIGGFLFINPEGATVYPGDGGVSWQTLPFIYSSLLAALALIYLVQSVFKLRKQMRAGVSQISNTHSATERDVFIRRIGSLVMLLAFAFSLKVFGLALATPVFLFLLFRLYQRGDWQTDMMLSVVGGFLLWVLFVPVLKMNLKGGDLDVLTPFLLKTLNAVGL